MLQTVDHIVIESDKRILIGRNKTVYTVESYASPAITILGNHTDALANAKYLTLKSASTATTGQIRAIRSIKLVSGNTVITLEGGFTTDTVVKTDTFIVAESSDVVTLRELGTPKASDFDIYIDDSSKLVVFAGAPTVLSYQTAAFSNKLS